MQQSCVIACPERMSLREADLFWIGVPAYKNYLDKKRGKNDLDYITQRVGISTGTIHRWIIRSPQIKNAILLLTDHRLYRTIINNNLIYSLAFDLLLVIRN